jgi:hypothetical protein
LCAAALFAVPALSRAQDTTNAPAAAPAAEPAAAPAAPQTPPVKKKHSVTSSSTLPFNGTLTSMDTNAMTMTVGKRTFNMTSETIITKDGNPAVLEDGVVGGKVRGAYKKDAEGKLDATTVRFGGAAQDKKKAPAGK